QPSLNSAEFPNSAKWASRALPDVEQSWPVTGKQSQAGNATMSKNEATMFKDGLLKDKRILITGGGTGLGEVMAEAYAKLGATVYICGRRAEVLNETAKRIEGESGSKVRGIPCDIRVAEAVDGMVGQSGEGGVA